MYVFCSRRCRKGTLDPAKVRGKIVVCLREGKIKSVSEGQEARSAGASGMILNNQPHNGRTTLAEPHVLSTVNHAPPPKKRRTPSSAGQNLPSRLNVITAT